MFGIPRRTLSKEQIAEKAYQILSELFFRSVMEGWSFRELAASSYIGFKKSGAVVAEHLSSLKQEKEVVCWIKLSEVEPLQMMVLPVESQISEIPFEVMLASIDIADQLTAREVPLRHEETR